MNKMSNKLAKRLAIFFLFVTCSGIVSFFYTLIRGGQINFEAILLTLSSAGCVSIFRSKIEEP